MFVSRARVLAGVAVAALAACLFASESAAQDTPYWPRLHGPNQDNRSPDSGLLTAWPASGPTLVWTAKGIGHGFSSVSLSGGRIFTAGNVGARTMITALDPAGNVVWQTPNGRAWIEPVPGTRATPSIDGDYLFHKNPYGRVACLDVATGDELWSENLLDRYRGENIGWALSESVLVDGDRLICRPGAPRVAMVALDKRTGREIWRSKGTGDRAGYCSTRVVEVDGLRIAMAMTSKGFMGVDALRGDLLWYVRHETPFDENIVDPVYHDGRVFITSRTTGSAQWKIVVADGRTATLEETWRSRQLDTQHGDVILLDGCLYGSCHAANNAKWVCLDWKTGRLMHAERGIGRGSLTYADGMFFMLNEHRTVGLVKASPERHTVVSQFRIPSGGEGPTWAHPVVVGGRLYVRHSDRLFAYDVKGP